MTTTHPAASRTEVPTLADGVVPLGVSQGSGYKQPPALVRRADGQVLQLTPLLYRVLAAIDGRRTYAEVAQQVSTAAGRAVSADDVRTLAEDKLRPMGLLACADGSQPAVRKANPLLALRPRVAVTSPQVTRRITAPFAVLFTPVVVALVTMGFFAVTYWVLWHEGLARAAYDAFHAPGLLLLVFAITVFSAGFHEFGHAAALRRGGGTPGAMGFGLYLAWPAFYTDVTDAYRLGRAARIRTDLGGLYFNAIIAVVMFGAWAYSGWDALLLVIAAQIVLMLRQLPPLVRFDGYHILADATGVPDLFHHIGPTLRSFVPGVGRGRDQPLRLWVRVVVTLWVLVVVPVMLFTALLAVVSLPRVVASAWHSVAVQAAALSSDVGRADVVQAAVALLRLLAVVVPVAGIIYMLLRTVRRLAVRAWQRTEGHPIRRALAGVVAAVLVVALAIVWWPHGNYRPIKPTERGAIQDVLPASWRAAITGDSGAQQGRLHEGQTSTVNTVWPRDAGAPPTRSQPRLAVVLSPQSGTGPTWVFPFNRPAPPGPGDNQSMAIVTKDGTTVYDVAFALVWATGDTVLNRNEAYAFASCTKCTAVAVSFQVVLVIGQAPVVAPQNISAAVNYNCFQCVAAALAVQLVITLPDLPTGDVLDALQRLWKEIDAFGQNLEGLSFAEIKAKIEAYEKQILQILQPLITSASASTAAATSDSSSLTSTEPVVGSTTATSATPSETATSSSEIASSSTAAPTTTSAAPASAGTVAATP